MSKFVIIILLGFLILIGYLITSIIQRIKDKHDNRWYFM